MSDNSTKSFQIENKGKLIYLNRRFNNWLSLLIIEQRKRSNEYDKSKLNILIRERVSSNNFRKIISEQRIISFISSVPLPASIFYSPVPGEPVTGSPELPVNAMLLARVPFAETAWGAVRAPPTCPMNLRPSTSHFMSQLRDSINCILSSFDFLLAAIRCIYKHTVFSFKFKL